MCRTGRHAIAILAVFGCFAVLGVPDRAGAQTYDAAELEAVELINAYRQENGLGTLSLSAPLSVASERHSEDMGIYGFFSHDTVESSYYPVGSSHAERAAQEGYGYDTFT
ncbi:MAG: CAP domain-containing protein, partial [Rubrobacteraceae bacterium]